MMSSSNYPQLSTTGSKLGAHVIVMNDDTAKFVAAGPGVVKFAGDWGSAPLCPPGTFVTGRKVIGGDDAQQIRARGFTPAKAVQEFIYGKEQQIETYKSNPNIQYWEGHNEPVWGDLEGIKWYADMEIARMEEMKKLGLKCVIGNFATGTPPMELWAGFMDALHAAKQYGAILGLHEYSCPWLWWMTGHYQIEEENWVDPNDPKRVEGWTTLRYRQVYRQFLEPAGLGDIPLVITEFGIDPMVNPKPEDAPDAAWKDLGGFWTKHKDDAKLDYERQKYPIPEGVDFSGPKENKYFEQLKWYDRQMMQDRYVIGATIFTFGSFGGAWERFDVTGTNVAGLLIEYVKQLKSVPLPVAAPRPAPAPAAPPSSPAQPKVMVVQPAVMAYAGLKIRASRNADAPFVESLPTGVQVTVLEGPVSEGNQAWLRVRTPSGLEGWVRSSGENNEVYLA
jgi:hypothetical protein